VTRDRVDTKSGPHRPHERIHKRAGKNVTLECGSVVKVVEDRTVHWFCHDIEMNPPFIEMVMLYELLEYIYG